jgi:hypothetical protein
LRREKVKTSAPSKNHEGAATRKIKITSKAWPPARSEGIRKGDSPSHPVELIVRRVHNAQEFREETVLRVGHEDAVVEAKVERQLRDALRKLLKDEPSTRTPRKKR